MGADLGFPVGHVKAGVFEQAHDLAVVLAQVVVLTARAVKLRFRQVGILLETVDERDVILLAADDRVQVAEPALVGATLARAVRLDRLQHAVAHERTGQRDDAAKAVGAQKAVDEGGIGADRDTRQAGVLAFARQREQVACHVHELLADELAVPFVDLGFIEIQPVFARRHDDHDVARLGRLDHMGLVDPVVVAPEQAVQQVHGAVWALAALGALGAVHLVDRNDSGQYDVALEIVGVEVDLEQCHSESLPREAAFVFRS